MVKDLGNQLVRALNSAIQDAAQRHPNLEKFRQQEEFVHPPRDVPDAEPDLTAEDAIALYEAAQQSAPASMT